MPYSFRRIASAIALLLLVALPCTATSVTTEAELRLIIADLRGGSPAITITFTADITLTRSLPIILGVLPLTIDGTGPLDCANTGRSFLIAGGTVHRREPHHRSSSWISEPWRGRPTRL